MDKSLQKALGVDLDNDPKIPGTRRHDIGKVIYALLPGGADPSKAFRAITRKIKPPIPTRGGVLAEHWQIKTSDDEVFYSILLVGEIEAWREQIKLGAEKLGLKTAKIEDNKLVVANGPSYPLSDCVITRE